MKALILSDGRLGHLNQSLALAKMKNYDFDICQVSYKSRFFKLLSYLFDFFGFYTVVLFQHDRIEGEYDRVIATGSTTIYPLKVLSRHLGAKSVSMMLPSGYRFDCDVIFAQSHDMPPIADNIIKIPVNFSLSAPQNLYKAVKPSIGIIIGGPNAVFEMSVERLKLQLDQITALFSSHELAVTTSPRTPPDIEELLKNYAFTYSVIYSQNPVNPIPDFLVQCERVFITQDSTSMISEAVSNGTAYVEVLPLDASAENKFSRLTRFLAEESYLHVFDGAGGSANRKVDFAAYLASAGI